MTQIIFRADATSAIGTGHVMRCLALAQAAKLQNISIKMIGRVTVPWVQERIIQEGIPFVFLKGLVPKQELSTDLLEQLGKAGKSTWVVLDGYHFTLACHQAVQQVGHKLLVIDDYAHLPEYSCDILLNQNLGAEYLKYKGQIGKKLFGLKFVLLRQEFIAARKQAKQRPLAESVNNILISLGGGDFSEHLQKIAPYFILPELSGRTIKIIAGSMPIETIERCFKNSPANIEILQTVDDMPALLLSTDLCITAGGSTCWELCCLRVPFLTTVIAENQLAVTRNLCKKKFTSLLTHCSLKKIYLDISLTTSTVQKNAININGMGARLVLKKMSKQCE